MERIDKVEKRIEKLEDKVAGQGKLLNRLENDIAKKLDDIKEELAQIRAERKLKDKEHEYYMGECQGRFDLRYIKHKTLRPEIMQMLKDLRKEDLEDISTKSNIYYKVINIGFKICTGVGVTYIAISQFIEKIAGG